MVITKDAVKRMELLILRLHKEIIKDSGGEQGIRDIAGLYHTSYKILCYMELHNGNPPKVGAFVYMEIARKHHFLDGNKRTSHAAAKLLMLGLGYHLTLEYRAAINYIIQFSSYGSKVSIGAIELWIRDHSEVLDKASAKYLRGYIIGGLWK